MMLGHINRQNATVTAIYVLFLAGAVLIIASPSASSYAPLLPFTMAFVGIAAFLLSYTLSVQTLLAGAATVSFVLLCEILGVNAGFPFGDFAFTSRLGPRLLDVPIVIPFAWLGVLIPAWIAADRVLHYRNIMVASIVVTAFDAVLELAADSLDVWHWQEGRPTELNYISWFGISYVAFTILVRVAKERVPSQVVSHLLFAQLLFLVLTDAGLYFLMLR